MTIKLGRKYLLSIVLCTFLWNQQASLLSQKIAIDSDITIIFDASNYVIAVKAIDLTEKIIEILNTNPNELNIE